MPELPEELVEKAREALDLDWVTPHTPPGAVVRYAEERAADLLSRLEAAEGERDRLREAADEFREDVRQFALLTPRAATPDFEALLKRAQEFRAALSTGDRQDDDSHVRAAEATQPAQARPETGGGAS